LAESLHTDTFTVYRPTGEMVQDPDTWTEVPELATILTDVKGKLQSGATQTREAQTPGVKVAETSLIWHTSVDTVGVLTDDVIECTASIDPELVGERVRVTGDFLKSLATARRYPVEHAS